MTIKEARRLLDDTKVYVYNKSVEIQHKLFNIGYRWNVDKSTEIRHKDAPFLYINKKGLIECGNLVDTFLKDAYKEISINDILNINIDKGKTEFNFKPFDKVLVRDSDNNVWIPAFFEKYSKDEQFPYLIIQGDNYNQCIPYNEKTAHLLGTIESYQE